MAVVETVGKIASTTWRLLGASLSSRMITHEDEKISDAQVKEMNKVNNKMFLISLGRIAGGIGLGIAGFLAEPYLGHSSEVKAASYALFAYALLNIWDIAGIANKAAEAEENVKADYLERLRDGRWEQELADIREDRAE